MQNELAARTRRRRDARCWWRSGLGERRPAADAAQGGRVSAKRDARRASARDGQPNRGGGAAAAPSAASRPRARNGPPAPAARRRLRSSAATRRRAVRPPAHALVASRCAPVYTAADLPRDLARRTPPPGEPPYTRGIHPGMYRSRLWTMRQYAGFGGARRPTSASATCSRRVRPGSRWRSTCRPRWATTPTTRWRAARSARWASRSRAWPTWRRCSTELPLDRVTTSMTINATAPLLLAFYVAVADARGIAARGAGRHGAERRAQGVHRARHLHLSAGRLAAADHRRVRVRARARCRSGTASR